MVKNILMVDDNINVAYTIKYGLEKLDKEYNVQCLDSGIKCLEILNKNELPDLIILDIMMPDMNGWEVLKEIRKNKSWGKIPIVFLSAKTDNFSKSFGKILAEAFIEKPFDPVQVKEKIDKILEHSFEITKSKEKIIDDVITKVFEKK